MTASATSDAGMADERSSDEGTDAGAHSDLGCPAGSTCGDGVCAPACRESPIECPADCPVPDGGVACNGSGMWTWECNGAHTARYECEGFYGVYQIEACDAPCEDSPSHLAQCHACIPCDGWASPGSGTFDGDWRCDATNPRRRVKCVDDAGIDCAPGTAGCCLIDDDCYAYRDSSCSIVGTSCPR